MAVIKKLKKADGTASTAPTPQTSRSPILDLELPTELSVPTERLEDYTFLIYGKKKIGKTSLVSHFTDTFVEMFEPGGKALSIYQKPIPTWEHFLGYNKLLISGNHQFKTVAVDTGDLAYERCMEYVCRVNGIQHPGGQNDYGQSWSKVKSEFVRAHTDLLSSGLGLVVIAHEKVEEIETKSGQKFWRIVPLLKGQADEFYAGIIDNIFYYDYEGDERFLTIRGNDYVVAGTRCERNFLTPNGEQIHRIPMGRSSTEAYQNLVNAFNNKQEDTYKEEEESRKEPEAPKSVKNRRNRK